MPTKKKTSSKSLLFCCLICLSVILSCIFDGLLCAQGIEESEPKSEEPAEEEELPIVINGDKVEYSTDSKEFSASGNVLVDYKGTKLSCQTLKLDSSTKEVVAQGGARLEDKTGVIEGEKLIYNFNSKTGIVYDAQFRANPYFGRSEKIRKVSDSEFISYRGYMTTCGLDRPHYRMKSDKIDMFPGDKVKIENSTFFVRNFPVLFVPRYTQNLKEPLMHTQFMYGSSKEWGNFLLTATRYKISENITGRIYFDYRVLKGVAEGLGTNYWTDYFGKGNFKFYYTQERDHALEKINSMPRVFERWFIRERHTWDIDEMTNLVAEYYKITDSKRANLGPNYNVLKDYFYREYEKNTQPASYVAIHRSLSYAGLDLFVQKRTNRWYDSGYLERLPEAKITLPAYKLGNTSFYFASSSSAGNYNKKNTSTSTPTTNELTPDQSFNRFDTTNTLSKASKVAFIQFTPFVSSRQTFYDKDINGDPTIRTVFSSGADMSTKFYRIFNINTNFLAININGLRHIITPTIGYSYSHTPTIANSKLKQIDGTDSLTASNSASLGLSNKFQTKRGGQTVDFIDLNVTNSYVFKSKETNVQSGSLQDFLIKLKILPYSWLRIEIDSTYKHSGNRDDPNFNSLSDVRYDLNFDLAPERTFAVSQRYYRKGTNEVLLSGKWRVNPKWKLSFYLRRNYGHMPGVKRGLREQEYSITRDLHCWEVMFAYNIKRGIGETAWMIARLKAFPEMEFEYNQQYHMPKPGSQSNP